MSKVIDRDRPFVRAARHLTRVGQEDAVAEEDTLTQNEYASATRPRNRGD